MMFRIRPQIILAVFLLLVPATILAKDQNPSKREPITLRAWRRPASIGQDIHTFVVLKIIQAFREKYPDIIPVSPEGLQMPDRLRSNYIIPLMQIAGDIAPDVLGVDFATSDTYIRNKFLYPLDKYIEKDLLGLDIEDGHLLSLDEYLANLKRSEVYEIEIEPRVPYLCWPVMRRECPYGKDCPYCKEWGVQAAKKHYHVWCFPVGPMVMALMYRKDVLSEAGLPDRVPETMEEMLQWARKITNPRDNCFGLGIHLQQLGWSTLSFLYSMGGKLVDQDAQGNWKCVFDSEEAVEAYYFVARLFLEPFENAHGKFTSVVATEQWETAGESRWGMGIGYLNQTFFSRYDLTKFSFGPVPKAPDGRRGSEFNSLMVGIYAGLEGKENKALRKAAWKYIHFYDGPEARKIRAKVYVENGQARFVQPELLKQTGYPEYVREIPKAWTDSYKEALRNGIPAPYGKNCQMVYTYVSNAINQIRSDPEVKEAIQSFDADRAKARIREILKAAVVRGNEKMLNILTPEQRKFRTTVASIVAVVIFVVFVLLFRRIFRTFAAAQPRSISEKRRGWQLGRYKWAYILLIPAVGSIALWLYYPLARGSIMAFQDYNVRGFSKWTGMHNFANVLFDESFWYAMWVSLKYTVMFAVFGFTAPIALALFLTEVPKGKILFRTLYYLPAVLSGVVVIFLWRGFYGEYGALNETLNFFVGLLNWIPGVQIEEFRTVWLDSRTYALICILAPAIWVGMGPGCLIYLAALKTVPDELYEAADIDGAGIFRKVFNVSLPSIRTLIMINFIGVMVATMKGGGQFALAMTGGGPWKPYGQTEFVGLHIYLQAFGYLRFGAATAMAWVLGSMLVGFTVFQLQRLSRMEFKTVGGVK